MFTLLKGDFCMKIIEGCKNLKKYNKLSIAVSGMIALCGCGAVAAAGNDDYSEGTAIVTSIEEVPISEATTEPFAYAGYGYKQYIKEQEELDQAATEATTEPFAYAGYGYKQYIKEQEELVKAEATTEPTTEPFAYAGYGYKEYLRELEELSKQELTSDTDMLYSTAVKSNDGKYVYETYDGFYRLTENDSLEDVCDKFNMTIDEFYAYNANKADYKAGVIVTYPVMEEFYIAHQGDNLEEIAIETGVNYDELIANNNLSLTGSILDADSYVSLHKFAGDERSYRTNKGTVNIIDNCRIFGDKLVQASGYAGASRHYLVLNNSVYSYGCNDVQCYTFDGVGGVSSSYVCSNAKDIVAVGGMPIAILRNDADVADFADSVGAPVDEMAYMQWASNVAEGYPVCTNGNDSYVVMNGLVVDDIDLNKTLVKTR